MSCVALLPGATIHLCFSHRHPHPNLWASNVIRLLPSRGKVSESWLHMQCTRGYRHRRRCFTQPGVWGCFGDRGGPPLSTGASVNTQRRNHAWGVFSVYLSDPVHGSGPLGDPSHRSNITFPFLKRPIGLLDAFSSLLRGDKDFKLFKNKLTGTI